MSEHDQTIQKHSRLQVTAEETENPLQILILLYITPGHKMPEIDLSQHDFTNLVTPGQQTQTYVVGSELQTLVESLCLKDQETIT